MRNSKWNITGALAILAFISAADAQTVRPAPDSIEAHLAAGKNAAGGRDDTPDFYGLVTAICVAPLNGAPRPDAPAPTMNPNRASTYLEPKKAFDDLYWMGTPSRSTWALTTSDGIILYDTQGVYDAEDLIVGSLKKLGLDPTRVKYVIVSHAHLNEVGGAKLMQERYGAHIVMGAGDWDLVDQSVNGFPKGKPKRDIVATDGMKITLGGRTVTIYLTPGHTPGAISGIFQVHDRDKPLTVAYSGGTEFNFVQPSRPPPVPPLSWEISLSLTVRLPSSGCWPIGGPARRIPSTSARLPWRAISKLKMNARKRCASSCSPSSTMPLNRVGSLCCRIADTVAV